MKEKQEWTLVVIKFLLHIFAILKLCAFLFGTLFLVFVHSIWYILTRRLDVTMLFHRWCCFVFNIKINIIGKNAHVKDHPVIYLSNHVSYLDVIILGSMLDGCFVAKSEVAGWPGFGMLAKLQKTIFIVREKSALMQSRDAIANAMTQDNDIILFPEGTSTDGWDVMQFKAGLLGIFFPDDKSSAGEYAIIDNALIQPIAIKHRGINGIKVTKDRQDLRDKYAWYADMELAPHLWDFAHMRSCEVEIHMLEPLSVKDFTSRFDIANEAQLRVAKVLKDA